MSSEVIYSFQKVKRISNLAKQTYQKRNREKIIIKHTHRNVDSNKKVELVNQNIPIENILNHNNK
jgi:hypothetical protein